MILFLPNSFTIINETNNYTFSVASYLLLFEIISLEYLSI
jgi:hypothetical protein